MNLRYLWRSVSLVFVLWFALFPTLSYASETVTSQTYTYDWREAERELLEYAADSGGSTTWTVDKDDVANGLVQAYFGYNSRAPWGNVYNSVPFTWVSPLSRDVVEFSLASSNYSSLSTGNYKGGVSLYTTLQTVDGTPLIDANDAYELTLNGLKSQLRYTYTWKWSTVNVGGGSGGGVAYYPLDANSIENITVSFSGYDGEYHQIVYSGQDLKKVLSINGDTFGFKSDIPSVSYDIKSITVHFMTQLSGYNWTVPDASSYHSGAYHDSGTGFYMQTSIYNGVLKIDTPDETSGLLSGIIEWLRSIRDGIVNVGSGVTNVFNSILELPSRIWTFIQEGLKMLFIPSEEDISNMHNQWDELMRDRFGAIYESGDIVHSFSETMSVNSAMVADTGGVITMPAVTTNLAGTNFTFGGYEVDLVPDGFQWLVTSLKMLINIVCTILFINALKGKIEVLLR